MQVLNRLRVAAGPSLTKKSNLINFKKQIRSRRRALGTIPCVANSDNNLPDDHLKKTHPPKTTIDLQSSPKISMPSPNQPTETAGAPSERALPSGLWEMELLLGKGEDKDVSASTIERWTAAYKQMARDAQDLGIPASLIPQLSTDPTKEELRQARDHLDRMMQSFLSAGL